MKIHIPPKDLKRQTFRSGGPGGQHQNKTESGVRYIHLPTGLSAESRSDRSQHQNDSLALEKLQDLMSRIILESRGQLAQSRYLSKDRAQRGGEPMRTYRIGLRPAITKDHHHGLDLPTSKVLEGGIDGFIQAHLLGSINWESQ